MFLRTNEVYSTAVFKLLYKPTIIAILTQREGEVKIKKHKLINCTD